MSTRRTAEQITADRAAIVEHLRGHAAYDDGGVYYLKKPMPDAAASDLAALVKSGLIEKSIRRTYGRGRHQLVANLARNIAEYRYAG